MSTRHHVSYSELSDFRQCAHKHDLGYVQKWTPAEVSAALNKGRLWHEVMEAHYRMGPGGIDSLAIATLLHPEDGEQSEVQSLVEWMYEGFCERYGQDEEWEVLEVEKRDEINLPIPGGKRRSPIKLVIKIDQLRRHIATGKDWLWDFKTGSRFPGELGLDLDDQFTLYQWGYEQLGYEIEGIVYDFARTQRNKGFMELDTRFVRIPIFRTPEQLENTAYDAWRTARRMSHLTQGVSDRATDSRRCVERCSFTEPCLAGRKGLDEQEFMRSLGYTIYGEEVAADTQTDDDE
jgi:hypothetical protein